MGPLLLTLAILHGADVTTTQVVLAQGGTERNPFVPQNRSANLLVGSAASAADVWILHTLGTHHPKLAKVITIAAIGVEGWAVAHNATQIR
jgi:hypothetical protein